MAQTVSTVRYRPVPRPRRRSGSVLAWLTSWLVALLLLAAAIGWRYQAIHAGRIFHGVSVNGVPLGGRTPSEAAAILPARLPLSGDEHLVLRVAGKSWSATMADLGITLDAAATAHEAFRLGRSGGGLAQWLERFTLWYGTNSDGRVSPQYTRDSAAIDALVTRIANEVMLDPKDAAIRVEGLSVSGTAPVPGRQLDVAASRERVLEALSKDERTAELVLVERPPHIVGAEEAAAQAESLLDAPLVLHFEQPAQR
ncbi:MAG: peptidoglycan binding domain-containing protein, partial [Ardenticatenaceae bacterium]